MFIQTQATDNPDCMKFLPGRVVTGGRQIEFQGSDAASRSPLASGRHPDEIPLFKQENDLILDPFMGSGTIAKVSLENGRKCIGYEISPVFVDTC